MSRFCPKSVLSIQRSDSKSQGQLYYLYKILKQIKNGLRKTLLVFSFILNLYECNNLLRHRKIHKKSQTLAQLEYSLDCTILYAIFVNV